MFFCSFVGLMSQMMSNKQTNKENNNNPIISASIAQSQRGFFFLGEGGRRRGWNESYCPNSWMDTEGGLAEEEEEEEKGQ